MGITFGRTFAHCDTERCSERIEVPPDKVARAREWLLEQGWSVDGNRVHCTRGPVAPKPGEPLTLDVPEGFVRVVTNYGGSQHLARVDEAQDGTGRHYALCSGTSAWTLESWAETPDHRTLRPDEIPLLPPCRRCAQVVRASS